MDSLGEVTMDGLGSHPIPDLRSIPFEELVLLAGDENGPINDVVARMVDGMDGQPLVAVTAFNSSIA